MSDEVLAHTGVQCAGRPDKGNYSHGTVEAEPHAASIFIIVGTKVSCLALRKEE